MRTVVLLAGFGLLAGIMGCRAQGEAPLALIPYPAQVERGAGQFVIQANTPIEAPGSPEVIPVANYLRDRLAPALGSSLPVRTARRARATGEIRLEIIPPAANLGDEGYTLTVNPDSILLQAPRPAGLFYGVQTLRQLLPPQIEQSQKVENVTWAVPAVHIVDTPRFPWRGLLLDVSRHFRTKEFVKRYIDLLAYHKMNVLHWHLTDDQGWRVEIKKYPKLTEVGAWRGEGAARYGGFYTQNDIREIVAYASSRFVTVVPEIEMPGHCTGALAAYPEYSCTGGPFKVGNHWGIYEDVYCAGKDSTFQFLQDVLTEVMDLFPSRFIHVGGDEVPKTRWKACPFCQKRIKDEGLKNEEELQGYFMRRINRFLSDHGRREIGWDEILRGGPSADATIQAWHGEGDTIAAVKSGRDVVSSPTSHTYLDYPIATTSLEKSYSFEPVPASLTAEQAKHILGLEGCMWGEAVPLPVDSDHHVFPRLCALAEVAWSPRETRSLARFSAALDTHLRRLKRMGVAVDLTGDLAGRWTPAQVSEQLKPVDWDVTSRLHHAGPFDVTLRYDRGAHGLAIEWAALLENGIEIARDTHPAFAGANTHDNIYHLNLPALHTGAIYTLRVEARSDGGTDSYGSVWVENSSLTEW